MCIRDSPYSDQEQAPVDPEQQFVDPNQAYVEAMSASEQESYYLALYGPQSTQEYVEGEEYVWNWEEAGCQGYAQNEVYPDSMGDPVSYTHLRAHETRHDLVCRLLLEKKKAR